MSNDKPGPPDEDRTIIMPRPGGAAPAGAASRPAAPPVPPPPPGPAPAAVRQPADARLVRTGINPLVSAASRLLALAGQLRHTVAHGDTAGLRQRLIEEIKQFEADARAQGIRPETVITARYALCTVLDEMVLSTPWGSDSEWSHQSLLSTFHNETLGGDKFFMILDRVMPDPATHLDLLELMYLCLSLGFKGKYMLLQGGDQQLENLHHRLYELIRAQRGEVEQELSAHWQPLSEHGMRLARYIPLWVVAAVAGALLVTIYVGFSVVLQHSAEPVQRQLEDIAAGDRPQGAGPDGVTPQAPAQPVAGAVNSAR